jgi:SET domain-containing protein
MKKIVVASGVYLCLFALKDIKVNEEIRYDYGPDDSNMPWRKVDILFLLFLV